MTFPNPHPALRCLLPLLLGFLGGCASLLGGSGARDRPTLYAPEPVIAIDPAWPQADVVLLVAAPTAPPLIASTRIVVRPRADEIEVLRGTRWAQPPPQILQALILRTLEDTGKLRAIARQGSGIVGDVSLAIDIRRFEADYSQDTVPTVEITVTAQLIHRRDQRVVAAHTFAVSRRADARTTPDTIAAFSHSLAQLTHDLAGWVLTHAANAEADGDAPAPLH